jgi:hypothetical protein
MRAPEFDTIEDDRLDKACIPNILLLMGLSLQEWSIAREREYLLTVINPDDAPPEQVHVIYYPTFCDWWKAKIPFKNPNTDGIMAMLSTYKLALHQYQKDIQETKGYGLQELAPNAVEIRFNDQKISKKKVEEACLPSSPICTFKKEVGRGLHVKPKSQTLIDLEKQVIDYIEVRMKFEKNFEKRREVRMIHIALSSLLPLADGLILYRI